MDADKSFEETSEDSAKNRSQQSWICVDVSQVFNHSHSTDVFFRPVDCFRYGVSLLTSSRWWFGLYGWVKAGHAASQQQPEASHSQFKKCVGSSTQGISGKTLPEIIHEVEKSIQMWLGPPNDDEEKAYTLMSHTTAFVPTSPDAWMWTEQSFAVHEPTYGTVNIATIPKILGANHYVRMKSDEVAVFHVLWHSTATFTTDAALLAINHRKTIRKQKKDNRKKKT